jgi:1,4-alpha-glucan branching enzyme
MKKGFLNIILHAHLPYVRHPERDSYFEEIWLFEAITECYVPLINLLDRLANDKVDFKLTLSLSPTLMTMLRDDLLISRYLKHLHKLIELAEKEIARTSKQPEFNKLAQCYQQIFQNTYTTYHDRYDCDVLSAFKQHQAAGRLDLITTAATHGFLPALSVSKTAVRNQVDLGIQTFLDYFDFAPSGFWLPECAYYPGLETILAQAGIKYFFVDAHAIANASVAPENDVYAPLDCGNGVMVFGRDPESSKQVWSAKEGYPGDADYREYYRDIGFDLDLDYIAPYILDGKTPINTGIKYYKVSDDSTPKEVYDPENARVKAKRHAQDFIAKRQQQIGALNSNMAKPPIIVAPYDAELFGHWWFEGPIWLEEVLRLASTCDNLQTASCSDYMVVQAEHQIATPSASTWGDQGYSAYWMNEENDWIYPYLHQAEEEMEKLASDLHGLTVNVLQERTLKQAARSILLAQASDWAFIMKTGTNRDYARKRITDHLARFNFLHDSIRKNKINERYLLALETMDAIFPKIDFRSFKPDE